MALTRRIPIAKSDSRGLGVSPNSRYQISSLPRLLLSGLCSGNGPRNGSKSSADIPPPSIPFASSSPLTPTPSSSALCSPTATPSQINNHKITIISAVCISTALILTTVVVIFFIRHSRKMKHIQTGKPQITVLSIDTPQPSPTTSEAPHPRQPSSSDNIDRSLLRLMTKMGRAQQDQQSAFNSRTREINRPVGQVTNQLSRRELRIIPPERSAEIEQQMGVLHEQVQRLSRQFEHLQRQLVRTQGLSDEEEPPAYGPNII